MLFEELVQSFSQNYTCVFDQVVLMLVLIHLDIPSGLQVESKMPVKSHCLQQVIEKGNPRVDGDFFGGTPRRNQN